MKKSLIFAGAIFLTSGIAIAKTIDFDTSIKWNSNVVERALNKSGFLGSSDAHWDVRVTHERILAELLKMESFSVRDATRVCLDKCNMSDFLKNGRGASGKKCPELCSGFADMLVSVNNEYTKTGAISLSDNGLVFVQKDGTTKVFSSDKQFYALVDSNVSSWNLTEKYKNTCNYTNYTRVQAVIFDNTTKQPCALLCETATGNAPLFLDCATKKCENIEFLLPINENTYFDGSQDKVNKIKELLYFNEQETNQTAYGNMLVAVNNELTETGNLGTSEDGLVIRQADGTLKIYSNDKKYYAIYAEKKSGDKAIQKYSNICKPRKYYEEDDIIVDSVVFESQTNKAIAILDSCCEGTGTNMVCGVGKYDTFDIGLMISPHHYDNSLKLDDMFKLTVTDTYKKI